MQPKETRNKKSSNKSPTKVLKTNQKKLNKIKTKKKGQKNKNPKLTIQNAPKNDQSQNAKCSFNITRKLPPTRPLFLQVAAFGWNVQALFAQRWGSSVPVILNFFFEKFNIFF